MELSFRKIARTFGGEYVPLNKMDSLINKILGLLVRDLERMRDDVEIYEHLEKDPTLSASELARRSKKSTSCIVDSMKRLRLKGALPSSSRLDDVASDIKFRNFSRVKLISIAKSKKRVKLI